MTRPPWKYRPPPKPKAMPKGTVAKWREIGKVGVEVPKPEGKK